MSTVMYTQFEVRNLHRDPDDGYWRAELHVYGDVIEVDRKHGSWQSGPKDDRRDVLPLYAARLQEETRPAEKRERKGAEVAVQKEVEKPVEESVKELETEVAVVEAEVAETSVKRELTIGEMRRQRESV